jgi:D-arabinan exo alpha-(1,3)/(1,5)-arabinofuranosidase (non-reducing end)
MKFASLLSAVVLATVMFSAGQCGEPITTESLVAEMIDMHNLAEFPEPAYKTIQFSSYDHRSTVPDGPNWFANSDGFGREPIPNFEAVLREPDDQGVGEYLVCDVKGPGAIVRTWTAAINGTIRMFLDDADTPTFEGPADEFFRNPTGRYAEAAGVDAELFSGTFQQRDACYLPIPFARRCRIVWTGEVRRIHFYEVQIRCYEPDADVKAFRADDLKTYRKTFERVAGVLADPQGAWPYASKQEALPIECNLEPGAKEEVLAIEGPASVERLTLKLTAGDLDAALRQTVLQVVFDDYPWGQVQSPVGDFFGAAPGVNPFTSVPFTVEPDGTMTCRYVMPFARSCKVFLQNRGKQPVAATGSLLPADFTWNEDKSMHFRARWRTDHDLVADTGAGVQDLPFLVASGRGVYVGTSTILLNPSPAPHPSGSWWGEGDEKIFVDEDVHPSTFGTGSEDYYNYSWSSPDIFLFPYCGQPRNDGPANRGFVTNNRWHILDALPFQNRIAFYMELFSHERVPGFSYARLGYHYGQPGIMDDHVTITDEDLRLLELPVKWMPVARRGSANSVFFQFEDITDDQLSVREGRLWAAGSLAVWHPKQPGDELTVTVPVAKAGRYALRFTAALTSKSGKFSASLGDKPILGRDEPVDLFVPYRTLLRTFSSPRLELEKGDQQITLRYEGGPTDADEPEIGLDFLWVQKQ